ncbi:MAG: hypothetical protein HN686_06695 [Bacteroidetes bacterium]|nr:hypothetical protein [Bacteroidota bacterium]
MATIKYQIRSNRNPANIYLRLSIDRSTNLRRKSGYSINPKDWSGITSLPKPKDEDLKNLSVELKRLANEVEKRINVSNSIGEMITGQWLEEQISSILNRKSQRNNSRLFVYIDLFISRLPYKELRNGRRGVSKSTIQKYETLKVKVLEFENYRKHKVFIEDVGLSFRDEFVKYLMEIDLLNGNTTGRYIKFLKTVCLDARNNGMATHSQLNQIKGFTERATKVYLSIDEIEQIEQTVYDRQALGNARDWLIIGCYIGQRVSDLLTLNSSHVVRRSGIHLIELTQKKTGKTIAIPIHPKVQAILQKREGAFPKRISDVNFNLHIKDVCKEAKITALVIGGKMVTDPVSRKTRKQYRRFPKYELVSSHICRRSFATNFYGEIPTSLLIGITGHSTERQFLEYIGKSADDYAIQLAEYWSTQSAIPKEGTRLHIVRNTGTK